VSGSDSRKALVVDFDRRTLAETQALLERHGIAVTPAASIQDVRQTLTTTVPPVIIIEPVLAEADGFDLCRAIVKRHTTSPPAVFMVSRKVKGNTAHHAASTAGALRFVELPNEASLLTELVDRAFSDRACRSRFLVDRATPVLVSTGATPGRNRGHVCTERTIAANRIDNGP